MARREIGEAKLVRELRIILLPAALAAAEPDAALGKGIFARYASVKPAAAAVPA